MEEDDMHTPRCRRVAIVGESHPSQDVVLKNSTNNRTRHEEEGNDDNNMIQILIALDNFWRG